MGKVITVVSGKDGMGKTTTAAAVSSSLALLGYKTLCLDFGTGLENVKFALGIAANEEAEKIDVLNGQDGVTKASFEHPKIKNLFILSMSDYIDPDKLDNKDFKPMFSEIRCEFEYCIVDTAPITYPGFKPAHADADMMIIVTTGEFPNMPDVMRAAKSAHDAGIRDLRLLANRVQPDNTTQIKEAVGKAADEFSAQLVGLIPYNKTVSEALQSKTPLVLYKKNRVVFNFQYVASCVSGETAISKGSKAPTADKSPNIAQSGVSFGGDLSQPPAPPPPIPSALASMRRTAIQTDDSIQHPVNAETSTPENDAFPIDDTSKFLASFGDPKLWAKSTLIGADANDLITVYAITPGLLVSKESIRNRMWLHDLLDDAGIPYYIEVGSRDGSKELSEAQYVYVEKKNVGITQALIKNFHDPNNIVRENPDKDVFSVISDDGIPQKKCPSCSKEIDFDFYKCPYCKRQVV